MEIRRRKDIEEDPRKKTLKCNFDLVSWVVIIMHVLRFD